MNIFVLLDISAKSTSCEVYHNSQAHDSVTVFLTVLCKFNHLTFQNLKRDLLIFYCRHPMSSELNIYMNDKKYVCIVNSLNSILAVVYSDSFLPMPSSELEVFWNGSPCKMKALLLGAP